MTPLARATGAASAPLAVKLTPPPAARVIEPWKSMPAAPIFTSPTASTLSVRAPLVATLPATSMTGEPAGGVGS